VPDDIRDLQSLVLHNGYNGEVVSKPYTSGAQLTVISSLN